MEFNLDDFLGIGKRRQVLAQEDLSKILRTAADIIDQQDERVADFMEHAGQARLANTAAALWIALTDVLMDTEVPK